MMFNREAAGGLRSVVAPSAPLAFTSINVVSAIRTYGNTMKANEKEPDNGRQRWEKG
jgi:hypothetical protein